MTVVMNCVFCGKEHTVEVEEKAFESWQNGELIQRAMPNLTGTQREQLISRICPKCQVDIFGEDE